MFWEKLWDILTVTSLWELLVIFIAKIVEVSLGTVRSILIVKGYRTPAVILALVEIMIWVFVASTVITGLAASPMKGISYGLGFAAGVYFGSVLENKLAFGKLLIQVIATESKAIEIAEKVRELGCGVTTVNAQGKVEKKRILMVYTNRRGSQAIMDEIMAIDSAAMIVLNDVSTISGGYIHSGKSLLK